jgi:hypothetical protein
MMDMPLQENGKNVLSHTTESTGQYPISQKKGCTELDHLLLLLLLLLDIFQPGIMPE